MDEATKTLAFALKHAWIRERHVTVLLMKSGEIQLCSSSYGSRKGVERKLISSTEFRSWMRSHINRMLDGPWDGTNLAWNEAAKDLMSAAGVEKAA